MSITPARCADGSIATGQEGVAGPGWSEATRSELLGLPPVAFTSPENTFKVTLYAPKKFDDMIQGEHIEACYQHPVLQYLSSQAVTNTTAGQHGIANLTTPLTPPHRKSARKEPYQ